MLLRTVEDCQLGAASRPPCTHTDILTHWTGTTHAALCTTGRNHVEEIRCALLCQCTGVGTKRSKMRARSVQIMRAREGQPRRACALSVILGAWSITLCQSQSHRLHLVRQHVQDCFYCRDCLQHQQDANVGMCVQVCVTKSKKGRPTEGRCACDCCRTTLPRTCHP